MEAVKRKYTQVGSLTAKAKRCVVKIVKDRPNERRTQKEKTVLKNTHSKKKKLGRPQLGKDHKLQRSSGGGGASKGGKFASHAEMVRGKGWYNRWQTGGGTGKYGNAG